MKVMKSKQDITLVAADSEIEGSLHFSSQLFVKGKVTGNILSLIHISEPTRPY